MSKLQEIKRFVSGSKELGYSSVVCDIESVNWLISQLEQAQAEIERLQADNQQLVEALELISTRTISQFMNFSMMAGHMRDIARQTLTAVKQE